MSNLLDRKEICSQPPSPTHAYRLRQPTQTPHTARREPGVERSLESRVSGEWSQRKVLGNVDLPWPRAPGRSHNGSRLSREGVQERWAVKSASGSRALCGGGWHLGQSPGLPGPGALDDVGPSDPTEGTPSEPHPRGGARR